MRVIGEVTLVDAVRLLPVERVGGEPGIPRVLDHCEWLRSEISDIEILVGPSVRDLDGLANAFQ